MCGASVKKRHKTKCTTEGKVKSEVPWWASWWPPGSPSASVRWSDPASSQRPADPCRPATLGPGLGSTRQEIRSQFQSHWGPYETRAQDQKQDQQPHPLWKHLVSHLASFGPKTSKAKEQNEERDFQNTTSSVNKSMWATTTDCAEVNVTDLDLKRRNTQEIIETASFAIFF